MKKNRFFQHILYYNAVLGFETQTIGHSFVIKTSRLIWWIVDFWSKNLFRLSVHCFLLWKNYANIANLFNYKVLNLTTISKHWL